MEILNILSPTFDRHDSYGIKATALAKYIRETHNIYVNLLSSRLPENQNIIPTTGGILMGYPTNYENFPLCKYTGPRMWVTAYESTKLPDKWVDTLNDADAIAVGAEQPKQWFIRNGVTKPVHSIPLGINPVYKTYRKRKTNTPFRILVILDRGGRRGWFESLMAIGKAFGSNNQNIEIVLKCRTDGNVFYGKDDDGELIEQRALPKDDNIILLAEDLDDYDMLDLYHSCHVLLYLGREGFGLPPREFAATGGASIALNWGGTADNIYNWGYPVPVSDLEPAWFENHISSGKKLDPEDQWAMIDVSAASEVLKQVYENWDEWEYDRQEKAHWASANYTWPLFASRVFDIYRGVVDGYINQSL